MLKKKSCDDSRANIYPSNATAFRDDSDGQLICETFHLKKKKKKSNSEFPSQHFPPTLKCRNETRSIGEGTIPPRFIRPATIDATKESLRRIASRSECRWRRRDRLRSFRARRRFSIHLNRLVCSDARSAGRREDSTSILPHVFSFIHLFSSSFFLFFSLLFFPLPLHRSSTDSFLTRHMTFRPGLLDPDGPPMLLDSSNLDFYSRVNKKI